MFSAINVQSRNWTLLTPVHLLSNNVLAAQKGGQCTCPLSLTAYKLNVIIQSANQTLALLKHFSRQKWTDNYHSCYYSCGCLGKLHRETKCQWARFQAMTSNKEYACLNPGRTDWQEALFRYGKRPPRVEARECMWHQGTLRPRVA